VGKYAIAYNEDRHSIESCNPGWLKTDFKSSDHYSKPYSPEG